MNNMLLLLEFLIMAAAIMCGVEIIGLSYYFNKQKYEERRKKQMRPIFSETTLAVVREALVPSLRRRVPDNELSATLVLLKRDGAQPLRKLADLYGVHHVTLRRWLKDAGKQPVCKGGGSGREELFLLSDAQEVMAEKGMAPKMQEVL